MLHCRIEKLEILHRTKKPPMPSSTTLRTEPKEMYCERLNNTVVCGGIYL